MRQLLCGGLLAAAGLVMGCGGDVPPADATASAPAPPAPAPPGDGSAPAPKVIDTTKNNENATDSTADQTEAPPAGDMPSEAAEGSTEVAGVGVGTKGNYSGPGLVTTPIAAYFRTGERIAFEIQIPSAMKLYKAGHDNKGPKTHEEFMNVIVQENGVQLPELPEGSEFVYDPKTEELLVRHPPE